MKAAGFALVVAAIAIAGCRGAAIRRVQTAGVDQRSGTVFAFEIDDARRGDVTTVIVCNAVLPVLCYRLVPGQLEWADIAAVQRMLEHERVQRALDARPVTPPPPSAPIQIEQEADLDDPLHVFVGGN